MTTQTPDAVREAAEEARDLLKTAQMASDGRRVTLHPTRVRLVFDRLTAALDSRAGDAGEEERARQFVERLDGWRFYNRAEFDLALFKGAQMIEAMIGFARSEAAATPAPAVDAQEAARPCDTCQGNGEVVTDWDRYMHAKPGDTGDEGTKDCPDCDGTGRVENAPAVDAVPAGEVERAIAQLRQWEDETPIYAGDDPRSAFYREKRATLRLAIAALSHGEGRK